MNTTQDTEFDYQKYIKESAPSPSEINRGTKAREKRREAAKAWISQNSDQDSAAHSVSSKLRPQKKVLTPCPKNDATTTYIFQACR